MRDEADQEPRRNAPAEGALAPDVRRDVARLARKRRRRLRVALLLLAPLAVLIGAGYVYLTGGRFVGTENAYIKADRVTISAEVAGPIVEVKVRENELVAKGDVLFRIDDRAYRVAVARSAAQLKTVRDEISGLKASHRQKLEEIQLARAHAEHAEREFQRQTGLAQRNVVSEVKLDETRHNRDVARHRIGIAQQELAQIAASLGGNPDSPIEQHARYLAAEAAHDQARLDLERTAVRAPFGGVAGKTPMAGFYVTPGSAVMSLVNNAGVWIEANFKETELANVRPGQTATIEIDSYPGRVWRGTVDSISQATGAEYSIIPPQNATGNWVKVVQRISVRIALTAESDERPLRVGMSVAVEIDTGHRRPMPGALRKIVALFDKSFAAEAAESAAKP